MDCSSVWLTFSILPLREKIRPETAATIPGWSCPRTEINTLFKTPPMVGTWCCATAQGWHYRVNDRSSCVVLADIVEKFPEPEVLSSYRIEHMLPGKFRRFFIRKDTPLW